MCGIVGIVKPGETQEVTEPEISRMLGMIRHRGPDQFGMYFDRNVGLGSARLSIIDLSSGQQPICNETQDLWIVFNGEIFNYVELKPDLEAKGHRFTTTSDTEVLLHLYEEYGPECLNKLNGQFAFAIWDARKKSLFMARDRLGVRPLFYTVQQGKIVFASEIKAILANDFVSAAINPTVLRQVFTYWSALSPQTIFQGVFELPPGHYLIANTDSSNSISIQRYWRLNFPKSEPSSGCARPGFNVEECEEKLGELLIDAAKLRLRADVPVGAYLSGGLDSSIIASIIRNFTSNKLDTFSIAFDDVNFDESSFQRKMASFLGTKHHVVVARHSDIGRVFPDVVWHTETPLMRTSPAPMFILSQLVRDAGYKVVLTGEGADEFLGGYDIFKEAKIRRFWARCPDSSLRPLLLKHLYPDIAELAKSGETFRRAFFKADLLDVDDPSYSHALRSE